MRAKLTEVETTLNLTFMLSLLSILCLLLLLMCHDIKQHGRHPPRWPPVTLLVFTPLCNPLPLSVEGPSDLFLV